MKRIDSHQHFWKYDPNTHAWINDQMEILKQDFMPPDLKREMEKVGVDGCVAVQAAHSEAETRFLLSLADEYDFIEGVVGWLDIREDDFEEKLEQYSGHKALKGLRHIVQDESDDEFLLQPDFLKGIEALNGYDLTYDILIYARQLPVAVEFASMFPDQKMVLDHIAKPGIKSQELDEWETGIRELAHNPNLYCKVSGMVTEADWMHWEADDFKPYLDVVFDAFGINKLMFGSDWPVCTLAADYTGVYRLADDFARQFSEEDRNMIMGGNAQRFYNLNQL